jgi:hypothetical protein
VKQCLAGPPAFAYLTQADSEMSLVNEAGLPTRGWIRLYEHAISMNIRSARRSEQIYFLKQSARLP